MNQLRDTHSMCCPFVVAPRLELTLLPRYLSVSSKRIKDTQRPASGVGEVWPAASLGGEALLAAGVYAGDVPVEALSTWGAVVV